MQDLRDPTLDDVEALARPVLVEPVGFFPRRGHRPVKKDGQLAAACDSPLSNLTAADHFEHRTGTKPCGECFPRGFPFTYDVEEIGPYAELGPLQKLRTKKPAVPAELIPDGELTLGVPDE